MARIEIEIEDYLGEVDTHYLIQELKHRKDLSVKDIKSLDPKLIAIPDFKTSSEILRYIKLILGLREWHDKKRIIQEIESL